MLLLESSGRASAATTTCFSRRCQLATLRKRSVAPAGASGRDFNKDRMETVLTGGKFNSIHPGHVWFLKKAKALGKLVVVIANDRNNDRPYALPSKERKKHLEELGIADEVVVGNAGDFSIVLKNIRPSVIVLGYDQSLPEGLEGKLDKIKVIRFEKHGNYSTGKINRCSG